MNLTSTEAKTLATKFLTLLNINKTVQSVVVDAVSLSDIKTVNPNIMWIGSTSVNINDEKLPWNFFIKDLNDNPIFSRACYPIETGIEISPGIKAISSLDYKQGEIEYAVGWNATANNCAVILVGYKVTLV